MLTEHYAGAFPAWLAPVQVVGIPIREDHAEYLDGVRRRAARRGYPGRGGRSDDRMQKKIRTAQQQKIPFMVIAGDDDVAAGTVSFRYRDGSQRNGVPLAEAVAHVARRGQLPDQRGTVRAELTRPAADRLDSPRTAGAPARDDRRSPDPRAGP